MEKFFDKVGLYDIWTILFPGVIFLISVRSLYDFMISLSELISATPRIVEKIGLIMRMNIFAPSDIYEFVLFLALSYLCGLVLHELSSILKHRIIYPKSDPRTQLLDGTAGILNNHEFHKLMPLLKTLNDGKDFSQSDLEKRRDESKYVFNRMNKNLQDRKKSGDYVKLNIIYNVCATLCVVFICLSIIILAFGLDFLFHKECAAFIYSLIFFGMMIFVSLILFARSKRYHRYWVRNIVFAYAELCWNNEGDNLIDRTFSQQ